MKIICIFRIFIQAFYVQNLFYYTFASLTRKMIFISGLMQIQQHILRQPVKNLKQGEATCGITPGQEQAITTLSRFEGN